MSFKIKFTHSIIIIDKGIPTRRAFFDEGRGPVHLSKAGCTSEDTDLLNCTIDKSAVNGCDHSEDAGVICSGACTCNDFIIIIVLLLLLLLLLILCVCM